MFRDEPAGWTMNTFGQSNETSCQAFFLKFPVCRWSSKWQQDSSESEMVADQDNKNTVG
jgi:hypothetical protein